MALIVYLACFSSLPTIICYGLCQVMFITIFTGHNIEMLQISRRTIPFICGILQLTALVWYISTNSRTSYSYVKVEFNEISPSTPSLLPTLLLPTLSPLPVEYPSPIQTDCSSTVHVAMVAPGEIGSRHLYTTIKSILMHRSTPLHFHFITDNRTMTVLKTMITTWALPAISQDYYDIHKAWTRISSSLNDSQTNCSLALSIQLNLHLILPNSVGHVLVIEPSSVAIIDLAQLWPVIVSRSNDTTTVCQSNCVSYCHDGDIELTKWGAVDLNLQKIVQEHGINSETRTNCLPNAVNVVDRVMMNISKDYDTRRICNTSQDGELLRHRKFPNCSSVGEPLIQRPPSYSMYVIQSILWQHHDCNAEEIPLSLGALAGFLLLCTKMNTVVCAPSQ